MNTTTKMTKLTAKELEALRGIDASEYGDMLTDETWSFSVAQNCSLTSTSVGGVVASLQKKGFVRTGGSGNEATIGMTQAGAAAYIAVVGRAKKPSRYEDGKCIWDEPATAATLKAAAGVVHLMTCPASRGGKCRGQLRAKVT